MFAFLLLTLGPTIAGALLTVQATSNAIEEASAAGKVITVARGAARRRDEQGACPLPAAEVAAKIAEVDRIALPGSIVAAVEAYCTAALAYDIDWAFLAAIGHMECFHGLNRDPGCNPDLRNPDGTRQTNSVGARGPMQFLGSTWRATAGAMDPEVAGPEVPAGQEGQGYATDGPDPDAVADPWSFGDAAAAAARYLAALGAKEDQARAAFGYYNGGGATFDPSHFYHQEVLRVAAAYHRTMPVPAGPVPLAVVEGITVHVDIAARVGAMVRAARADGVTLTGGGFRTREQQIELRRRHCGPTDYDIWVKPSGECHPPTAIPGQSNHERGLAIDFDNCGSHETACWRWLDAHAADYGLYNLPVEPWHWSVNGR